jgi:hypothetical protein
MRSTILFNISAELSHQAEALRLIPLAHFQRLVFGLWPEDNFQRHVQPWSLARTSAHGMADFGFFRCSAQRRSSSARSASDSSNAPSRSASLRLSHKAIASSARSLAGSLSSSVRGLDAMRRSSHGQPRGAIQPPSCDKGAPSSSALDRRVFSGLTVAFTSGRSRAHQRPSGATHVRTLLPLSPVRCVASPIQVVRPCRVERFRRPRNPRADKKGGCVPRLCPDSRGSSTRRPWPAPP